MNPEVKLDRASAERLRGELLLASGQAESAIEPLALAATLSGSAYDVEAVALAHFRAGHLAEAREHYERVLAEPLLGWEVQETWLESRLQLGLILEQLRQSEDAARLYENMLERWRDADEDLPVRNDVERRLDKLLGPGTG